MINHQLLDFPIKAQEGAPQEPFLTSLNVLENGSLFISSAFDQNLFFHVALNKKGTEVKDVKSFAIPEVFGGDSVLATGTLISNSAGDTAFVVLHRGSAPGFLSGLVGGKWPQLDAFNLKNFLAEQDGGMGFGCRHSVAQVVDGELIVRRFKESGALLDVVHMGDYVLGLNASSLWREGYLEQRIEKRIYVRKDFMPNGHIHRDAADNFWFFGAKNRLHRMKITDIKAKPTFRSIDGPMWELSEPAQTDGWLYGVEKNSKRFFRVRENPISYEDELQEIAILDQNIDSLCAVEIGNHPFMLVATSGERGCELAKVNLAKSEDLELLPPIPSFEQLGIIPNIERVKDLTFRKLSESQYQVLGLAFGGNAGVSGKLISITF